MDAREAAAVPGSVCPTGAGQQTSRETKSDAGGRVVGHPAALVEPFRGLATAALSRGGQANGLVTLAEDTRFELVRA
jgi:hypothetical protein